MTDLEKYLQSDLEILNLAHPKLALCLAVTEGHYELTDVVNTRVANSGARPGVITKQETETRKL